MEKKKKRLTPDLRPKPFPLIPDAEKEGMEKAQEFFDRLQNDKRVTAEEMNMRLNDEYKDSYNRMIRYDEINTNTPTASNAHSALYWRYYHHSLAKYIRSAKPKEIRDFFNTDEDFDNAMTAFKNAIPLNKEGELVIHKKGLAVKAAWHVFNAEMNLKSQVASVFIKLFAREFGYILRDGKNTGYSEPKSKQYQTYKLALESAYNEIKVK